MVSPHRVVENYETTKLMENTNEQAKQSDIFILLKIESQVVIAAALLVVLVLFGSYRRRSNSPFLRFVLWGAFTIPAIMIPYAIGLMHSARFENKLFVVWTTFLIVVLGSASSISAYSLNDNESWRRIRFAQLVQIFWAWWLLLQYAPNNWSYAVALGILLLLSTMKLDDRYQATQSACMSYGVESDSKVVADYMQFEHQNQEYYDPVTMIGYRYLVAGEESAEKETAAPDYRMRIKSMIPIITVEKIWQCKGALLSEQGCHGSDKLRDICLAFALFKMLRRRCAGYQLAESLHPKTRDFVLKGLLNCGDSIEAEATFGERAFRVIEVELAFFYDSFYTKYPVIFYRWKFMLVKSCLMLVASMAAIVFIFINNNPWKEENETHLIFDVALTYLVVLSIYITEYWQIMSYVMSDWAKVLAVCTYIRHPKLQGNYLLEQVVAFFCRRRVLRPWKRKLGQYSLINSCYYTPSRPRIWIQAALLLEKTRNGQKASSEMKLTGDVKRTIAEALRNCLTLGASISNVYESLERKLKGLDQYQKFEWVFRLPNTHTHTHKILIWHIATEICMHGSDESIKNIGVAADLSRYCAYLVAFAPELLPEHKFVTSCIFDEVVKEMRQVKSVGRSTRRIMKREDTIKKLKEEFTESEGTVVGRGAKLARHLMEIADESQRWQVLAEFWAEMLLYLAPSDNVKAHAERLARGGEFITHIWALLTHAGILRRPDGSDLV